MLLTDMLYRGAEPDDIAVVCVDGAFTYAELWERVGAIRAALRGHDVEEGDRVALFFERGYDYVATLIAALELGLVAVPADRDIPTARLRTMMDISGVRLVACADERPPWAVTGAAVLDITASTAPDGPDAGLPATVGGGAAPAMVLFTSGSTGVPKGVLLHHSGLVNRLDWGVRHFGFDRTDRVLHKAAISFDASLHEIFTPLMCGGTLVIAPPGMQYDTRAIVRLVQETEVTTIHFVPSVLRYAVNEPGFKDCLTLRRILCGGEALDTQLARAVTEVLPCDLISQYGPTETSISVTYWDCRQEHDARVTPLGYPIRDVACHVLDSRGEPVPVGEPGELWVGGVAVGLGYVRPTPEDAARFAPSPFADGERLYRTGDLVRQTPEGYFHFLGRIDAQVKVRGVRTEPEEVANVLRTHPWIVDAATVARSGTEVEESSLVAYVVAQRRHAPRADGLDRVQIPGGPAVVAPVPDEALFLYRQIFELREYGRFGISLPAGAVVVDVGANIGMFALWAHAQASDVRVVAVEPNPDVLPYLRTNLDLHDVRATIVGAAVREQVGTVSLQSFPQLTHLSGVGVRRAAADTLVDAYVDALRGSLTDLDEDAGVAFHTELRARLAGRTHQVAATTLARVFDDVPVRRVDLLKVNVEGSELAVMRSLRAEQWARVRQVAVEIERSSEVAPIVTELLVSHGFRVERLADWSVGAPADVAYLYASRDDAGSTPPEPAPRAFDTDLLTTKQVLAYARDRLPAQMVPRNIVFLERLPRLPNGKIALGELPAVTTDVGLPHGDASSETDRLRDIWRSVLGVDAVGDDDHFLDLGGQSLSALRVTAMVRQELALTVSPTSCLGAETFESWCRAVLTGPRTVAEATK